MVAIFVKGIPYVQGAPKPMHEPSPDLSSTPIEKEHAERDRELAEITGLPNRRPLSQQVSASYPWCHAPKMNSNIRINSDLWLCSLPRHSILRILLDLLTLSPHFSIGTIWDWGLGPKMGSYTGVSELAPVRLIWANSNRADMASMDKSKPWDLIMLILAPQCKTNEFSIGSQWPLA